MVKRVFQAVVLFFAIYAFAFVPLGRKTALEHVRAIVGTPAAHQAATELKGGVKRLVHELRDQAGRATEASDEAIAGSEAADSPPTAPIVPAPSAPERAKPSPSKPRPPELANRPRKSPQRFSFEPAAASNAFDPSQLDLTGFEHSSGSGHSAR